MKTMKFHMMELLQKTFLLSYYTSKSEQAENSLVLPIKLLPTFMVNFGYPYNDLDILLDHFHFHIRSNNSTDYLHEN